jgi:serine/threonine protein kinase
MGKSSRHSADIIAKRYKIEKPIGSGGIADVFLAVDLRDDRQVALKRIHSHLVGQERARDSIRTEYELCRTLNHPGIVELFDLIEDRRSARMYLVMEYLSGGDLKSKILREGFITENRLRRLAAEILAALDKAHGNGVIHRDLKPQNILFDDGDHIRISDFGLARCGPLLGGAASTYAAGTPEYASPEMASGLYVDSRSDLYSVGIILYEAATGRLPFRANSPYEILQMQIDSEPEPPHLVNKNITPGFERIIRKAMEKDPGNRFQTAEQFRNAIIQDKADSLPEDIEPGICPACGLTLIPDIPFCVDCGHNFVALHSPEPGQPSFDVIVTGPGKTADTISHRHRIACLKALEGTSADTTRLRSKVPRLPFFLIKTVNEDSANSLAGVLAKQGLETSIANSTENKGNQAAKALINKKVKKMTGRYALIVLFSSAGMYSIMARNPVAGLAVIAISLVTVGFIQAIRGRTAEARIKSTADIGAVDSLVQVLRDVRSLSLKSVGKRIASKTSQILKMTHDAAPVLKQDLEELKKVIAGLTKECAGWILDFQAIDDALTASAEESLYDEKTFKRQLKDRRQIEQNREILMDRILSLSSRLDSLTLSLSAIKANRITAAIKELRKVESDLEIEAEAIIEVQDHK